MAKRSGLEARAIHDDGGSPEVLERVEALLERHIVARLCRISGNSFM